IFLSKVSGQEDIVIGTPTAGRNHPDLEQIMGMFVNTLALRSYPRGEMPFTKFLHQVRTRMLGIYENEGYPFEILVEKVELKRDMSRNPLFDVMFTMQDIYEVAQDRQELNGLEIKPYTSDHRISKFDLSLGASEHDGRFYFFFEYCTKLFREDTILEFVRYFKTIVLSIIRGPMIRISDIEMITGEERRKLLYNFNDTQSDYPRDKTIHELFAEQVEQTPDSIAVFGHGQTRTYTDNNYVGADLRVCPSRNVNLTYRQLNEKSDRLAGLLIGKGVLPDNIVGIMVERSVEMIVGIFGILKSGGAYLPIDPEYPQERIDYMLKDSNAKVLIINKSEIRNPKLETNSNDQKINDQNKNRHFGAALVLNFEHLNLNSLKGCPRRGLSGFEFRASNLIPSNLAYIIYTSGTTGKPKAVLIEHKNVVRLLFNDRFQFDFNDQDVWSLFHSTSFDFSVWEMYGALLYGGRLVVIPRMTARDPQQFLEVLIDQKVTVLNQTPSAFYNLITEELKNKGKDWCLCLRYVIFGGEALKPARLHAWRQKYPRTKLVNMFGITETCVHVTYKEIGELEIEGDIGNIGKPIPTLSTYIMDRYRRLAPIGTPGELYVGGEGVARGYLNQPELTSERFVGNSYKAGERLYRSGDLARMCPEGEMVYLGRVDHQVQLRGFRIELGEIENRLLKHEGIKEAVVMERSIPGGDLYLCAYIVPQPGILTADLEAASIREFVARQLPDYMIPAYVVQLEEIPLTANGKIDRRRLPQPEVRIEKDRKSPRNETEEKLAEAWQGVLGLESVGIEDNFFDVGGDSIKAIRLISRINERLNSNLKIVDLYTNRTIGELAGLIDREESESVQALYRKVTSDIEELKNRLLDQMAEQDQWSQDEIEDVYPMSDIEKGMVFSYMKYARMGIYHDQLVYPLYYKDFDIELFKKALTLLVRKNEILRTGFNLDEFEEPVQVVYKEPKLNLVYTDLAGLPQDKQFYRIEEWLSEDRKNPFESSKHPLWRMQIFTLGNDRLYLGFIIHHAILDGWSVATLMTELHNTYFELKKNTCYVPVKLKSSYKDTVIEERIEKENTRTLRYWQEELADYTRLEFSETLKSKEELYPMKVYRYNKEMELLEKVKQAAAEWNTSIKNLCFSAYAYMMGMFSYEKDIVTGCVNNNRTGGLDGDKVLGCFLNTTPVRLRIPGNITWKEYVVWVEQKMHEVKQHERLPLFEIAFLIGEKNKDRNPIFDTLFNFTDFHVYRQAYMDEDNSGKAFDKNDFPAVQGHLDTNTLFDFEVDITSGRFSIHPKYNAQVISDNMVKKCCIYFVNILEKYINDPDSPARRDDILPLAEKENLLQWFNDTQADYSREKIMPMLFEEQVLKTPDNSAVIDVDGLRHFTYRQLNENANRLAHGLRKMGVKTGDFVGVVMERRMEMVWAVMAILKAGGAYVPLEPYLPDRRIEKILESLETKCTVADSSTGPRLEAMGASLQYLNHIVSLDDVGFREFKNNPVENPAPASGPEDISYVIYTSGSTGVPKGVVETHRPVVNVIQWVNKTFDVGEKDRLLFVASLGFDLSVYDIFGILASGGAIRTVNSEHIKDPVRLLDIMIKEGITFWDSAPAALQQLVPFFSDVRAEGQITALRLVFLSGDWIPVSMPNVLRDTFKGVRVISLGGATEATIWSNYYPIGDVDPSWPSIPYGKPIQNARYYILDTSLNLCPINIAGDLYIGGECLAKEYKNDPALTAARFVANPFCPGEKMYKTGDSARWFEDGNMQFLGRKDHQVKIRGYRIELGEIESQLSGYPGIREAIVIDREDGSGNKYICAYYTVERAVEKIEKEELITYLSGELPEYMIPAHFIPLERVPVTPNGKLDRNALPGPGLNIEESYAAPENELQEKLVEIWKEVLFGRDGRDGRDEEKGLIGIDDDFFELGGHSLNATVVIAKIHKMTNVKVPLAEMFKRPTIRELAEVIKKSSKEKYVEIRVVEKKEYYLLSSAQRRLYFLRQLEPDSVAYNIPIIIPIIIPLPEEEVNIGKLEDTFKMLIKRHESLRTSFHMTGDEPVQKIHDNVEFEIEILEIEGQGAGVGRGAPPWSPEMIKSFIRPFDLSQAPLLRVGSVRLEEKHLLLVDIHHIITDGISMAVLKQDFMALYQGGKIPSLRIQYKDFAGWQNGNKESEELKRQELYWLNKFAGEIPLLNIPTDYPRPLMQSHEGNNVGFEISVEETRALIAMALKESATLFMILAAVLNILLAKLCGQEDIVIGTPVAGRRHADLEKIIGLFVNTLVLRNYPIGEKSFTGFLKELRERALEAFENQEYQFEDLVEKLVFNRDMGRNPLFDVFLVTRDIKGLRGDGAANRAVETGMIDTSLPISEGDGNNIGVSKFDLEITALEVGQKLKILFGYCTKLFKKETILGFIRCFKQIISSVIEEPGKRIMEIEIISAEERQRLLFDFNRAGVDYPGDKTVHELFEEQAGRTPDRAAVFGHGHVSTTRTGTGNNMIITYRQLNEQSERLAGLLIEKGVLADNIVGIMMERSIDMIIGILGILKAGGAYLPIDTGYPQERIDFMIKDSSVKIIVTTSMLERLPNLVTSQIPNFPISQSSNLAYIIYTSGSTGRPKGVMVVHRGVARLVKNNGFIEIEESDRLLATGALAFDISTFEIWGPLTNGASLYILDKAAILDTTKLGKAVITFNISILHLIPQLFDQAAYDNPGMFGGLGYFLVGGDYVRPHFINMIRGMFKNLKILHMYGPTENTTFSTYFPIGSEYNEKMPIGKPKNNSSVFILDKYNLLAPVGVCGELCAGGEGIARGYLNSPELTSQKFLEVQEPFFKKVPGPRRVYKTGDLARWLADGNIEFLGRIDHQVKIRGIRVELGEIESRLAKHPGIKKSIVLMREDERGDKYLCAYVVSKSEHVISGLREYLAKELPDYMIPSYFVPLEKIPLTPNGKIDRRALPKAGLNVFDSYTAPRNEIETELVKIWSELLGRDQLHASQLQTAIGIDDNFFQLGGHSLKATALAAKIHKTFEVKIPLSNIFKTPTIRGLSEYMGNTDGEQYTRIAPVEKKEYYTLSSAQKRLYVLKQLDNTGTTYNIPSAWILEGVIDSDRLERAIMKLIERHESLRTSFEVIDSTPAQRIHGNVEFKIEYHESSYVIDHFIRPFDLTKAPLLRVGLIKIEAERHILAVDMHHIISDGMSARIIARDFSALYSGDELPEMKLQYKDYAEWLNSEKMKESIRKQEEYWLGLFAGAIPVLNLPVDFARPLIQDFEGNTIGFRVGQGEKALKMIALEEGATFFMALLSIFTILLAKLGGREDIIVGIDIGGRRHADIQDLIGMFVNALALRNFPAPGKTFREFLREVKAHTLAAFDNQDYPFEELVAKVSPSRDTGRNPIFDV
ncbi:MAG TPA: amino acid adenylation domain-containing protein, partial [Candidatus Deferrimicrobium sp.]|nr:amino acid adenylation domain-containing protein [Candidatus Deferrimicrobium sp.]